MFCEKCGRQMTLETGFCSGCGAPANRQQAQTAYAHAPSPPQTEQQETALAESKCQFAKGAGFLASRGNVMITDQRIVYFKHGIAKTLLMGHAVHLTKGSYEMEFPFTSIASLREGRQGLSRYLDVHLASGEHHRIYFVNNYEGCVSALRQAAPHLPFTTK